MRSYESYRTCERDHCLNLATVLIVAVIGGDTCKVVAKACDLDVQFMRDVAMNWNANVPAGHEFVGFYTEPYLLD